MDDLTFVLPIKHEGNIPEQDFLEATRWENSKLVEFMIVGLDDDGYTRHCQPFSATTHDALEFFKGMVEYLETGTVVL